MTQRARKIADANAGRDVQQLFQLIGDLDKDVESSTKKTPVSHTILATAVTITAIPAAVTEVPGYYRLRMRLENARTIRISCSITNYVVGSAAILYLQYSTDGSTWADLTSESIELTDNGLYVTEWEGIPVGAQMDAYIRIVTSTGDGADAPVVNNVTLQTQ